MNALQIAIATYAKHAILTVEQVESLIASGDERACKTVAILRLRFSAA